MADDPHAKAAVRCDLCGSDSGDYFQHESGLVHCTSHPWCETCEISHLQLPCMEHRNRILSTRAARTMASRVLDELDSLGIGLPRVPVRLVMNLPGSQTGLCVTRVDNDGLRVIRSAQVQIRSGLGPMAFGQVVAHEHTHALLHLHGAIAIEPKLEEGICQLIALVWLTNQRPDRETLWRIWHNSDPIYGGQLRRVVPVARRTGVGLTLKAILAIGELP
jgi:hypothetical protein